MKLFVIVKIAIKAKFFNLSLAYIAVKKNGNLLSYCKSPDTCVSITLLKKYKQNECCN